MIDPSPGNPLINSLIARFETRVKTRILAFGSSNTERRSFGMHWFDVFDLALKKKYGRFHHCINTGVGGHTSTQLLARFEEDAALYQPHMAIVTVGGNDFIKGLSYEQFRANLVELFRRFNDRGTAVVFQTYYSPDAERQPEISRFYDIMEIMREVAAATGAGLVDQLRRWEFLRTAHREKYLPLMIDSFHVNWRGNILMGLELLDVFRSGECLVGEEWQEGRELQALINALDTRH